jgi:hypothetical protein
VILPADKGDVTMAILTLGRWINPAGAALGAIGALVLYKWSFYKWSFALERYTQWHGDASIMAQRERNLQRQRMQRAGLGLICASFAMQGLALLFY